jgi:hypothetical protein
MLLYPNSQCAYQALTIENIQLIVLNENCSETWMSKLNELYFI